MQQICIKRVQDKTLVGVEGVLQRLVQATEIWLYYQMVYAQTRICPREWDEYNSLFDW